MKTQVILMALLLASSTKADSFLPFARLLGWWGVEAFRCNNPRMMTNFNVRNMEGRWFQKYASYGTEYFGCQWVEFTVKDKAPYHMQTSPDFVLDAHWTAFDTPWNPFEKAPRAK